MDVLDLREEVQDFKGLGHLRSSLRNFCDHLISVNIECLKRGADLRLLLIRSIGALGVDAMVLKLIQGTKSLHQVIEICVVL